MIELKYLWYLDTIIDKKDMELIKVALNELYTQASGEFLFLKDCVRYAKWVIDSGESVEKLSIVGRYLYELDQAVAYPYWTYLRRHHPDLKIGWQKAKKKEARKHTVVYSNLRRQNV